MLEVATGDHRHSAIPPMTLSIYSNTSDDDTAPSTPVTEPDFDGSVHAFEDQKPGVLSSHQRRASTILLSQKSEDVRMLLGGDPGTKMITKVCCGGGCCIPHDVQQLPVCPGRPLILPANRAYEKLGLQLPTLGLDTELTGLVELAEKLVAFQPFKSTESPLCSTDTQKHPPPFVTPHPPYGVFSAPLFDAKELTKPGAEKRTFHYEIDVTDYPDESGTVDFVVGGAIGVCAPNAPEAVDNVFDLLAIPAFVRDKKVLMRTTSGRWPTIWGDDNAREVVTTRRELLTWCSDLQSFRPTKPLLRLLAAHAEDAHERKILEYLCAAQGQSAFCDLRTGPYVTLVQLLAAFPSSRPPLDHLLSVCGTLMPRFYSLSQDPQVSCRRDGTHCRKLIEIAVTVHEAPDWDPQNPTGTRTGVGSGFLQRIAQQFIAAQAAGQDARDLDLRIPMFRGLMANPLAREFVSDGPMLLIGAGVGIAPFRGFVHRRLKSATCANKVWVLQGVRDSLLDELYSGDWGVDDEKVKKVVQSRDRRTSRGACSVRGRYVQEEVRAQADLVWSIINALDGRIFVCGASQGMGEGVESALVDVAVVKGNLNEEEAKTFWEKKKKDGQYIAETW